MDEKDTRRSTEKNSNKDESSRQDTKRHLEQGLNKRLRFRTRSNEKMRTNVSSGLIENEQTSHRSYKLSEKNDQIVNHGSKIAVAQTSTSDHPTLANNKNNKGYNGKTNMMESSNNIVQTRDQFKNTAMKEQKELTRAEKRKLKKQEKAEALLSGQKQIKIRLFPIWLRILIVLFFLIVSTIAGAMIGYGVIGDGKPTDVFKKSTWTHIIDIVNKK
ncbi:DNA-directed RNA polymerase subunit beta [Bacillus chungangensis]|uniref:DNA-directed RNA polymerase subunit beta n=1 Tax=Bacillus chungangensis TaxID=587633 RepID=A0ABT9WVJ3_9BACI|nr:DNA-directed RNA polymerase subunit beta [Bacillus chungangensis]MDQ0177196.1 hypothetical protein [Bacillus chungangensis]